LIATDNHLGYKENDKIRGHDSFASFHEIMRIARGTPNLDFLLLGGDLFHEHKPSRKTFFKLQQMMNETIFGEQDIKFETYQFNEANYMNENLSVAVPIFMIHGNHDDPSGLEYLSNIDLMNSNNYVNYFGKVTNIEDIEVVPILFVKGKTKIALYGIGHMKDERLNIAFENKKIKFKRPLRDKDEWFNILVLHQNKYKGMHLGCSRRNSITEGMIPKFFHLVVWAHEHESIPQVFECQENGVHFL
jgi:double-strand break repair protein MRE11